MFTCERLLLNGCESQSFYRETLSKSTLDIAVKELGETTERKIESLREIKLLLREDNITANIEFEEDFVIQYLRHAKYDVKRAFRHLRNFTDLRKRHEYIFKSIPDEILNVPSTKFMYMLPWRCPNGCSIVVCAPGHWDPGEMSLDDFKRQAVMVFEQSLRDPMNQICGFKVIVDFKNTGVKHVRYSTPSNLHLFYYIALATLPVRHKEVYIVNQAPIFKLIWTIIKGLLSEKLKKRIYFLEKAADVTKFLPREIVPPQYGGNLQGYDPTDWLRHINKEHGEIGMGGQKNYY